MDAILNIHKPSGPTSFAVVARVKRLTGERRVGHGGTLDPLASGVLPVFLGRATRLAEYLMEYPKTYHATVELGAATDTYDAEGSVTSRSDISNITLKDVETALEKFRGEIRQRPPVYSALKQGGQPLHRLARRGQNVEVESRPVTVYRLEILAFELPRLTLEVECSKGTYIRSLAHDLGAALGCGGHLAGLVRTAYGPFDITDAVTLEQLESGIQNGAWRGLIKPMDCVLSRWEKITLDAEQAQAVLGGKGITLNQAVETRRLRAYDTNGVFLALLQYEPDEARWRPYRVFAPQASSP